MKVHQAAQNLLLEQHCFNCNYCQKYYPRSEDQFRQMEALTAESPLSEILYLIFRRSCLKTGERLPPALICDGWHLLDPQAHGEEYLNETQEKDILDRLNEFFTEEVCSWVIADPIEKETILSGWKRRACDLDERLAKRSSLIRSEAMMREHYYRKLAELPGMDE